MWPNQDDPSYKDHIAKLAEPLIGDALSASQKTLLSTRIIRRFSLCLWVAGRAAPRVEGYAAHVEIKPNATPVCQQQFPLSAYDQLRLEYHEDLEVHEGKAFWLEPGVGSPWSSPSFVVDQPGKGSLARPARDYRIVNAATLDHAWPAVT